MSTSELMPILELLPEPCQEQAIISCLEGMLARGEWGKLDDFLLAICQLAGHETLKALAFATGVKCAVRSNELCLALARYNELSSIGNSASVVNCMADALLQLTSLFLPDRHSQLLALWRALLTKPLSADARDICLLIGQLLVQQCQKNHDDAAAIQVKALQRRYLVAARSD